MLTPKELQPLWLVLVVDLHLWLHVSKSTSVLSLTACTLRKEKKRKDYAFWRQFNEKPSIIPGCPDACILGVYWVFRTIQSMSLDSPNEPTDRLIAVCACDRC